MHRLRRYRFRKYRKYLIYGLISVITVNAAIYIFTGVIGLPEFEENPTIDGSFLSFKTNKNSGNVKFRFEITGAVAHGKAKPFCKGNFCKIPITLGGQTTVTLSYGQRGLFKREILINTSIMNCTDELWTNRICTFRNICTIGNQYYLKSPYKIDFEKKLLCLGSKTPPVDFEPNRVINQFRTISDIDENARYIHGKSYMASIYYNMHMLWHQNFDFMLPLYNTLTRDGPLDLFSSIFFPSFVHTIPPLTSTLSRKNVEIIKDKICFEQLTMGMHKITDLSLDKKDPPYSFCDNCSQGLRRAILRGMAVRDKYPSNKTVLLLRRSSIRSISNAEELFESLRREYGDVEKYYFEEESLKRQIEIASSASVFIGVHGSGLAHVLWMGAGSVLVEVMPYQYTCNDWYRRAARAAGVRYMEYHSDGDKEVPKFIHPFVRKCMSDPGRKCKEIACKDGIRDQIVTIDPDRFIRQLNGFINKDRS